METFDLKRILLSDSKTSELGVYNFTPIEVFTINRFLPFGTKLELEERPQDKFLTFINIETGKVNVIYRLKDNKNFGLVEPEA